MRGGQCIPLTQDVVVSPPDIHNTAVPFAGSDKPAEPPRRVARWLWLWLCLAAPAVGPAWARVDVRSPVGLAGYSDFGLQLINRDLEVDYDDGDSRRLIDTQSYAIFFLEPVTASTRAGFTLGRIDLSQAERSATRGMTLGGYFIALSVRSDWSLLPALSLRGQAHLGYADVDGRTDAQTSELNWTELALSLDGVVHLGGNLRLLLGNRWVDVDGEERTFGDVDGNSRFDLGRASVPRLGAELVIDRSGYVGVQLERGRQDGFMMYFQRRYR